MPFRFIHTADLHLDSPLRSLAMRNSDLAELIGDATRQALVAIVNLCIDEQVDALIIAGDLYDGDQTSMKTARFLAGQMQRLHEAGIGTFIIRGNHDALSRITQELILPPTVTVFGGRSHAVDLAYGDLALSVHGLSFAKPHAPDSLLDKYRRPAPDAVNIGIMHTSLAGAPGHDHYAPCKVSDLHDWGFDYWALGHVHVRAHHAGERMVIMPGIPQGRDINEAGEKTVTLVTVNDDRSLTIEERATSVAQFERIPVDLSSATTWREAAELIDQGIGVARDRTRSAHLVGRLQLTGATPLSWQLRRDRDLLLAETEQRAEGLGKTWIEKIEIATTAPVSTPVGGATADPVLELGELNRLEQATRDHQDLPAEYRSHYAVAARKDLQLRQSSDDPQIFFPSRFLPELAAKSSQRYRQSMGFMATVQPASAFRAATTTLLAALFVFATPAGGADYDPLDQAFTAAQWAMLSSAGRALQQTGLRAAAGDPELARRVRDRQDLADRARVLEDRLADVTEAEARIALRGEVDSLEDEMASIDLVLERDFPRFADLSAPEPLSIGEVQAMLGEDEALLLFLSGRDTVFIFAVSRQRAAWHRTPYGAETLAGDIAKLRRQLDPLATNRGVVSLVEGRDGPRVPGFDRGMAHLLYLELLAPFETMLAKVSHLHVVADGPISGLPLSLLVTARPQGEDTDPQALRDTAWLVKRHAVTTLPDVGSLRVIRDLPTALQDKEQLAFAGFGAPVLGRQMVEGEVGSRAAGQAFFRGVFADVSAVRNLPALPQTGPEVRRLATALGGRASLYLGADATETAVKSADLYGYDVIAFATHGLLSGDLEGLAEPALVLTPPEAASSRDDGLLTASEIAALKLTADWVILSACNTAGSNGEPDAEGLSGLARAFLYAGARSILVSHWPVRDDAAAMLTTGAIERLSTGAAASRSEALRQAMLEVMNSSTDFSLAHPSAWAPFAIVGEGG